MTNADGSKCNQACGDTSKHLADWVAFYNSMGVWAWTDPSRETPHKSWAKIVSIAFNNIFLKTSRLCHWDAHGLALDSDLQVCTKQQYQQSFPTRTQKRTRGAQMAPWILSQASHSALRRFLQLPASANDHGREALQSLALRSPLLHTQLHPWDKVTSIRSLQTGPFRQPMHCEVE